VITPVAESKLAPVYFDSALIAKFYLKEPGREAVRQVARSAGAVVSSGIAVVEVSAAFHRKLREGAIELRVLRALLGQFAHDLDTGLWRLAGPTEAVLRETQAAFARLDESIFVRSLDALHLVTAKSENFDRIYSNDRHLLGAARSFGLQGVNPTLRERRG
jgi:predicted nucleic acid-binding protein